LAFDAYTILSIGGIQMKFVNGVEKRARDSVREHVRWRLASCALTGAAVTLLLPVGAAPAYAQAASEAVLEEIRVTARKRAEDLQDVPDSVAALSAETLERANVIQVRDVTARIPNVSIEESLSPTSTFIGVRGVISTRNGEPAVAVVVDGVQIGSATEVTQALYDLQSIEVLKGPQGALYGRNAIGGAIIVTSKPPSNEAEGNVTVGVGNGDLMEFRGSLTGPLTDSVSFRVAANYRDFAGTLENANLAELAAGANVSPALDVGRGRDALVDFETNKDVRAQLLWEVNDATRVDLRFSHSDLEAGSYWYRPYIRLESTGELYSFPINNDVNTVAKRLLGNATLKIDHDISAGTFTSITSYTDTEERYGVPYQGRGSNQMGDVDFFSQRFVDRFKETADPVDAALIDTQLQGVGSHNFYDIENFSQEFRFTSRDDAKLRWVGGAYLLLTERNDTIRADLTIPGSLPLSARLPNGLPGPTDFATTSGLLFDTSNTQDNTAWALFLNMDYDLTEKLTLTAAVRYDEDQREITRLDGPTVNTGGEGLGSSVFGAECVIGVSGCVPRGFKEEKTFSAVQPKLSLAYRMNEDVMFYGTAARGFRSGGFNASGALLAEIYDEEILDSYEIGTKTEWLDGRLRVNAAAFYMQYDDVQVFEFDGSIFVQSLFNIPESEISGFELTFDWLATENLTISAGFGFLDSEVKEFNETIRDTLEEQLNARITNTVKLTPDSQQAFDNNFEGYKLTKFPHQTANVSAVHEYPVSWFGGGELVTRLDYQGYGDRYWWIDNTDKQGWENILDGSLGLVLNNDWEIAAWCKNCLDNEYIYSYEPAEMVLFGGPSKDIAYDARRRTYGLQLKHKF
jgi:iron complex outermembrane receptor protein